MNYWRILDCGMPTENVSDEPCGRSGLKSQRLPAIDDT